LHRCPVCHSVRRAKRPVQQWRCRSCHEAGLNGCLEITSHPAGKR
jgi:ribosomal protein L37AE/L43A